MLEDVQSSTNVNKLPAECEDKVLPIGPTGQTPVTIYRPKGSKGALPVVMYFHGGGWILGSKNTHDRLLRDLVNGTNAAFVFVNYTPSPEAQFPIPIEQGFAATKYITEHGDESDSTRHGLRWQVTASAETWPPSSPSSPKSAKAPRSDIRYFSIR